MYNRNAYIEVITSWLNHLVSSPKTQAIPFITQASKGEGEDCGEKVRDYKKRRVVIRERDTGGENKWINFCLYIFILYFIKINFFYIYFLWDQTPIL